MPTFLSHVTVKPERAEAWRARVGQLQRDGAARSAHVARLQRDLGPPAPGGQLPAAFLDFFAKADLVRYDPAAEE